MLILVCGNIAVGKSTVARLIHNKIGGIILQTNEIRNKWYPNPSYSEEEIDHVYDLFFNEVKNSLKNKNVILDATFSSSKNINRALDIAKSMSKKYFVIEVLGPSDEQIKQRILERKEDINKTDFNQYLKVKDSFEPIIEPKIVIHNRGKLQDLERQIAELSFWKNHPFR
mgnify:CR=1 FL=1